MTEAVSQAGVSEDEPHADRQRIIDSAPLAMISSLLVNTKAVSIGARHVSGFAQPVDLVRLIASDGHG